MVFGDEIYKDAEFKLQIEKLDKVDNLIHLGLPIGDKA